MNGFGFIEYDDPLDARDMVPGKSCSNNLMRKLRGLTNVFVAFRKPTSTLLPINLTCQMART